MEVEHVKAHRTKKDKKDMSQFEKCVAEGNEKADELAKAGAMFDEGFMAEARAKTLQQEREEVYAALQHAASCHCVVEEWKDCEELKPKPKEKWNIVDEKWEETKHRTEWCADANKCRCMRCGRGSNNFLGKWRKRHLESHDMVRIMDRQGEVLIWCRKCWGYARHRMGLKLMNCCKPEQVGTKAYGKMSKRMQTLEDGRVPAKEAKNCKIDGQKKRITWTEYRKVYGILPERNAARQRCIAKGRRRHCQRVQGYA